MRIIDLTHTIDPEHAGRKFELKMIGADEVNHNVVRLEDQWYIMHDIAMVSHIGTHIEMPYHVLKSGNDLASVAYPVPLLFEGFFLAPLKAGPF